MAEPDLIELSSFVPDSFKGEDDAYDTGAFRQSFDDLSAFKAAEDDRVAQLPKEAGEYEFKIPEGHAFPEGFDPETMKTQDEDGNEVEFDVNSLVQSDDPDIPLVQALLHKVGAPSDAIGEIASIMANREIRNIQAMQVTAGEEKKALGPEADARISAVTRAIKTRIPEAQATALLNNITSADALRGFEGLMKALGTVTPSAPGKQNLADMTIDERIDAGLKQRRDRA